MPYLKCLSTVGDRSTTTQGQYRFCIRCVFELLLLPVDLWWSLRKSRAIFRKFTRPKTINSRQIRSAEPQDQLLHPPPRSLHIYIYIILWELFSVMAGTFTPEMTSPRICLCNGQPHQLHTKLRLSKCNFLTRNGLHENYVMCRKLIPPECFYVCSRIF